VFNKLITKEDFVH